MRKLTDLALSLLSPKQRQAYFAANARRAARAEARSLIRAQHPAVAEIRSKAEAKRQARQTRNLYAVAAGGMIGTPAS